jgi:hypothetical protein
MTRLVPGGTDMRVRTERVEHETKMKMKGKMTKGNGRRRLEGRRRMKEKKEKGRRTGS